MTKAIKSCIWNRTCEATTSTRVVSLVCIFYIAIVYSTKQNRQAGMQLVDFKDKVDCYFSTKARAASSTAIFIVK
jgi:hypothetical protein